MVGEKGWEVSPPPDGSPLLANWQNHLPWQRGEAICMMDQERKRQCHGVKYRGGERQESSAKVICVAVVALDHFDTNAEQQEGRRWK